MRNLTIRIENDDAFWTEASQAALRIEAGEGYQGEHRSFANATQLFETFSPKRWELIQKLQAIGPSSLRGLARAVGRDVKRVHEDAAVLLEEGIIERDEKKKLFVPFARIHIDVDLEAPATSTAATA